MRIKQIHVLNLPQVANIMFKIAFGALGQKIKDRVLIHANQKEFLKNFEEHDILPKEYGGTISWRENNEIYKEHLRKNQEKLLAMDEQFIGDQKDESKSNFGVGDSFVGSFRKLEVD